MAVIVNDMGEVNLDAEEIKSTKMIQEDAQMVEMQNGCICCTLRGDLLKTVKKLSDEVCQLNNSVPNHIHRRQLNLIRVNSIISSSNRLESGSPCQSPKHSPWTWMK